MAKNTPARSNPWLLPMLVGAAVTLAIVAVFWFAFGGSDDQPTAESQPNASDPAVADVVDPQDAEALDLSHVEQRDPDDPLAAGEVDAPVTMVVFSDYQCPYCAAWSNDTLPTMMDYVDDGQLRIEWRDLNMYGEPSERASKAGYAAGLQDAFWQFHEQLFAAGETRGEGELTEAAMIDIAEDLGLDIDQFTEDMHAEQTQATIEANQRLGTDLGAYSTPSFLVGGEPMVGAQPTDVFVDAIDNALAERQE